MPQTHTYRAVAEKLEQRIRSDPHYDLPRIVDLMVEYCVCYATMCKAVRILVDKSVLISKPGKQLAVSQTMHPGAPRTESAPSAVDHLVRTITDGIQDGTYRAGMPFPKSGHFAISHHASYLTVAHSFAALQRAGLAHKVSNRWFVGPRPQPSHMSKRITEPTILLLFEGQTEWYEAFERSYTGAFMLPLRSELQNRGFRVMPAVMEEVTERSIPAPAGIAEIRTLIRELGENYRGTLIHCIFPMEIPIGKIAAQLERYGKPVVYFDSTESGADLTRQHIGAGRTFYRVHLDERAGISLALAELARHGHRSIGIHGHEMADWTARRARLIVEECARMSPPMQVILAGRAEECWSFESWVRSMSDFSAKFSGMLKSERQRSRKAAMPARTLMRNTQSLTRLLAEHEVTALVALNDYTAREYHFWLTTVGLRIPQAISIISFDNLPSSIIFPISTIDWGFERLGYQAAHIFLDDIPIKADRAGNIPGRCTLIDWGSVGAPSDTGRMRTWLGRQLD